MQGHTDDQLQGFGIQQVLGQNCRVWPALPKPQGALGGTLCGPRARTMPPGVAALRLSLGAVLSRDRLGAGGPGGQWW